MNYDTEVLKKLMISSDKLIELTEKKVLLLKEMKRAIAYELSTYHLVTVDRGRYILFRISDKKEMSFGSLGTIKSYINIRAIDITDIMDNTPLL